MRFGYLKKRLILYYCFDYYPLGETAELIFLTMAELIFLTMAELIFLTMAELIFLTMAELIFLTSTLLLEGPAGDTDRAS